MFDEMQKVTQGSVGLGVAIGYFCAKGMVVSLPLVDNQDYDLIVDDGTLRKIQVKTTGVLAKSGNYEVQLKSVRSNTTTNRVVPFDSSKVDYVFVLCSNGTKYLIPSSEIHVTSSLTLTPNRDKFKV